MVLGHCEEVLGAAWESDADYSEKPAGGATVDMSRPKDPGWDGREDVRDWIKKPFAFCPKTLIHLPMEHGAARTPRHGGPAEPVAFPFHHRGR